MRQGQNLSLGYLFYKAHFLVPYQITDFDSIDYVRLLCPTTRISHGKNTNEMQ